MDTCGFPKDSYYYYKAAWGNDPVLHIFPHWNWPGKEGTEIEVWAYSNCEKIELFCNGRSLGSKEMIANSHILWKVPYEPGELAARGRYQGKEVVTRVATTGNALTPKDKCDLVPRATIAIAAPPATTVTTYPGYYYPDPAGPNPGSNR